MYLFAVLAGVSLTLQAGVNSQLRLILGNPIHAGLISFLVGAMSLGLLALLQRQDWPIQNVMASPWWVWTGGFLGAFLVMSIIMVAPRIGATTLIGLIITGQMLTAMILDHFGALGFPVHPIRWERLLGTLFLLFGAVLIKKF